MKKLFFILVFMIAALAVNAQTTKTTTVTNKATRTSVKVADLQKAIKDNIEKDYAGFNIKQATSVTTNNNVTYEVVLGKGTILETLVYDKDGVFVKKLPSTPMKK